MPGIDNSMRKKAVQWLLRDGGLWREQEWEITNKISSEDIENILKLNYNGGLTTLQIY